jgi:hypothetical protein
MSGKRASQDVRNSESRRGAILFFEAKSLLRKLLGSKTATKISGADAQSCHRSISQDEAESRRQSFVGSLAESGIRKTRNGQTFGKYAQPVLKDEVNFRSPSDEKIERLRHETINTDPYTKRTAGCAAATPALRSQPVGAASCTTQAHARRPLEYPHLAVAGAYGTDARPPIAPSPSSDTSRAALESLTEANCHVLSNPHVHRTPATDSRRSSDPTSRMD